MFLPFELNLRPSRVYRLILALAHGLALAGIWLAALLVWVKGLLALALFAGAVWLWRENSNGPRSLRVSQSGQIEILDVEWLPASIKGQAVVLLWLVSLNAVLENGAVEKLLIWPDSADADGLRKLRVWLRWGSRQPD